MFVEPGEWSESASAALQAKFVSTYGGQHERLKWMGVQVQLGPSVEAGATTISDERVRLWRADRQAMVQFAKDICALNVFPPYRQFEEHLPDLQSFVTAYLDMAKPIAIRALGQRYVNRIELPGDADLATFFNIRPALPSSTPRRAFSLMFDAEPLEPGSLVVTLTHQGVTEGKSIFLLDLYAQSNAIIVSTWSDVERWQRDAHLAINRWFEMAITDVARNLFSNPS